MSRVVWRLRCRFTGVYRCWHVDGVDVSPGPINYLTRNAAETMRCGTRWRLVKVTISPRRNKEREAEFAAEFAAARAAGVAEERARCNELEAEIVQRAETEGSLVDMVNELSDALASAKQAAATWKAFAKRSHSNHLYTSRRCNALHEQIERMK